MGTDSVIWTNPAHGADPFAGLVIPDDLDEIAAQVEKELDLSERLKPYNTRPSLETLLTPIY